MPQVILYGAVLVGALLPHLTFADEAADREAIRVEIEQLRESDRLSVGDEEIASGDLLANGRELDIYERAALDIALTDSLIRQ